MELKDVLSLVINNQKYSKSGSYKMGDILTPKNEKGVHTITLNIDNGKPVVYKNPTAGLSWTPDGKYYYLGSIIIDNKLYYLSTFNNSPDLVISSSDEWKEIGGVNNLLIYLTPLEMEVA